MSSESLPPYRRFELVGQRNMNLHRRAKNNPSTKSLSLARVGGSMLGYHCSRRAAASDYQARSLEQLEDVKASAGSNQRCLRIIRGCPFIALAEGKGLGWTSPQIVLPAMVETAQIPTRNHDRKE